MSVVTAAYEDVGTEKKTEVIIKVDSYKIDGWMICTFISILPVFQSYQDDGGNNERLCAIELCSQSNFYGS